MRALLSFLLISCLSVSAIAQTQDSTSIRLHEVEVSATSKPSTALSSTPLQVLTESQILQQGIQSVADAVKRFNGIVLKDYGGIGGIKTISIRGMGAEYTAISYDGMVMSNSQSGQVDIGRLTLDNISLLTLSIGQDDNIFQTAKSFSSAGVLNLQTKKPEFTDKNYNLGARITTGSFGHFEPMLNYAQKLSNKTSLSANINWQRADGKYPFELDEGDRMVDLKRRNSDTNILRSEINLYNKLSDKDNLDVKLYYFDSERGLPGSLKVHDGNNKSNDRQWDKNIFAQISYDKIFSPQWAWKSLAKYDYNYQKYRSTYFVTGDQAGEYSRYKQNEAYWSNMVRYKMHHNWSASLSQDLIFNSLRSSFPSFNDARKEPNRYSSYTALAIQYRTQRVTLTASGLNSYIHEKITNKEKKNIYRKLSPAISVSVKPLDAFNWRLRASYKHIFRVPTFNEEYFTTFDKFLNPESSSQFNIGTTWVSNIKNSPIEYINISVDAYYNDVKDKIIIIPSLPFPSVMNAGKVKMKGLDAKLSTNIKLTERLSLDISGAYSYILAYDDDKENTNSYKGQLPYTPKHSGSASLTFNNPWVNLTYAVIASGKRYTKAENIKQNEIDAYTDHTISAFREFKIGSNKLYTTASLLNVLNKNYDIIAYYPMPGRSFKISVGYNF